MIQMLAAAALQNPFLALLGLAVIVLAILVVIVYIIRVAALVVLAAAAPLLLIGHTLPQTERYARAWWRATLALFVAPVAQSLLLAAAFQGAAHERWRALWLRPTQQCLVSRRRARWRRPGPAGTATMSVRSAEAPASDRPAAARSRLSCRRS